MNTTDIYHFELGKQKFYRYDRKGAVKDFQQALTVDPDNQLITGWLAITLALLNEYEEYESVLGTLDDTETSEAYIAKGIICKSRDNDNQLSLENFENAISLDPNNEIAYIHRGLVHSFIRNKTEALADLEKALELNSNSYTYTNSGYIKGRIGNRKGAIADLKKATELEPKNIRAWAYLGLFRDDAGDHQKALDDYDKAIALDPEYGWVWYRRGRLNYKHIDDFDGALNDLNNAVKFNPTNKDAWRVRGHIKAIKGNPHDALDDCNKAIEIDPQFARAYRTRGCIKSEYLSDLDGALQDFDFAIELNPKDAYSWANRGSVYFEMGNSQQALENFNKAIELDPKFGKALYMRGRIKNQKLEDRRESLVDLNEAIKLDPKYKWIWFERGFLYECMGELEGSLADYNKAIELDPDFVDALNHRGFIKLNNNDSKGALEDFNKAIILDPGNKWAWGYRGLLKSRESDPKGALDDYNRALDIDRNYSWVLDKRADLLKSLGHYDLSLADRSRHYEINGIPKRGYNDPKKQDVFDNVYLHLNESLFPALAEAGEKFIDYWICELFWGDDQKQSLHKGNQTVSRHGSYGLGYICLSDKYLRVISIGIISKKYAKDMGLGLGVKIFSLFLYNYDFRSAEKNDKDWIIPFKDIQGLYKDSSIYQLVSHSESWELSPYFGDGEYMLAAIELARTGVLRKLMSMEKTRMTSQQSSSQEDITETIERLAALRGKGLITNDEFEQKKKELLARL